VLYLGAEDKHKSLARTGMPIRDLRHEGENEARDNGMRSEVR